MRLADDGRTGLWQPAGAKVDFRWQQALAARANSIHFQVERVLLLFGAGPGVGEDARRVGADWSRPAVMRGRPPAPPRTPTLNA